jgi:UDP-N-acetyl-2-amino-2-deoxyglucuronate dehydrogenase
VGESSDVADDMKTEGGPLRLSIVGCGFVGGIHSMVLWGLRRAGIVNAAVVATCDTDIERARMFALYHGADVATDDPAEAMESVDAAWICTPTSTHKALVELASSLGIDVYCEKPLAPTLPDAENLAATAEAGKISVQVGLVLRHSAVLGAAHDTISSGELGRLMAVTFRDDQYFPIQGQYASSWRADASLAGGGTLIEHSIHDLDVLNWLAGPVSSVSARTANYAGHRGVEDVAAVTLAHQSGTTSNLMSVWHRVLSRPSTRRIEIFCERGILWTEDTGGGPLKLQTSTGVAEVPIDVPAREPGRLAAEAVAKSLELPAELSAPLSLYVLSNLDFIECLATRRPPSPGVGPALAAHRIAALAYRSATQGGGALRT